MTVIRLNTTTIARNIFHLRNKACLSKVDLANRLNVSPKTIHKWEKGDNYPELVNIISICNLFDIQIDKLIGVDCRKKQL